MTIYYPDVSQFTPNASLTDTVAVCARASEGDWLYDTAYTWYKAEAAKKKCPFFAYHVVESGSSGAAQARWCHNRVGSIPVMMDIEKAGSSMPRVADVVAFIDAFRKLGGRTWLAYLPHWYWQSIGSPSLAPIAQRGCKLVSSAYTAYSDNGPGWAGYGGMQVAVWQYTDTMNQHGIHTDGNAFKGTQAQLISTFTTGSASAPTPGGGTPAPAPATDHEEDDMPILDNLTTGGPAVCLPATVPGGGAATKVTLYADSGVGTHPAPVIRTGTDPSWSVQDLKPAWGKPASLSLPKGTQMVTFSRVDEGNVAVTAVFS